MSYGIIVCKNLGLYSTEIHVTAVPNCCFWYGVKLEKHVVAILQKLKMNFMVPLFLSVTKVGAANSLLRCCSSTLDLTNLSTFLYSVAL